ncbi:helix-turn-helix domain-containing protein [Rhodovibrio salinarum]|uniref:Helix-turn-helix domain-containing protein n=1 Tax=Rhodovibrio salinarum TaxID=1087 RepID=A0A934V1B2_9PROT|nr:helix-turn-helix domain-containing protein [Rhodovibrio salinarum]
MNRRSPGRTTMPRLSRSDSGDYATWRQRFLMDAHRQLVCAFQKRAESREGLTKTELADRLGLNKSVISQRLNGNSNLTLEVVSDMARAMNFRPNLVLTPCEDLARENANSKQPTVPSAQRQTANLTANTSSQGSEKRFVKIDAST